MVRVHKVYHGIDFANSHENHSQCWLLDDGNALTATFSEPSQRPERTAVDCPFGTSSGFDALLRGYLPPDAHRDGFKTRATERYIRALVGQYRTMQDWRNRTTERNPTGTFYFSPSAHVKGTVGMVIVPGLLAWLGGQSVEVSVEARLFGLRAARLGDGPIVEAHPRMFLYSVIERLHAMNGLSMAVLRAIAGYKGKTDADLGKRNRRTAYQLVSTNRAWQPADQQRRLAVPGVSALVQDDHIFDAWLAALTAWSHDLDQTLTWTEAGLPEDLVAVEGHMLILRPAEMQL